MGGVARIGPDPPDHTNERAKLHALATKAAAKAETAPVLSENAALVKDEKRGLQVFYSLKKFGSPGCGNAVTEFRDYWRSLPQLEGLACR